MTPAERKALKARAHSLGPVVHIGGKGLTESVVAEIARALDAHELIKVRAAAMDRHERATVFEDIATRLQAQPVQHIGKVLVFFREKPART